MKYMLVCATALIFMSQAAAPGFAQSAGSDWDILYQQGEQLFESGKYDRAAAAVRKALEAAEKYFGPDHRNVAICLNTLALIYQDQFKYEQAEPLYARALAVNEIAWGLNHSHVATSLANLAALYRATNMDEQADALEQRAARIRTIQE